LQVIRQAGGSDSLKNYISFPRVEGSACAGARRPTQLAPTSASWAKEGFFGPVHPHDTPHTADRLGSIGKVRCARAPSILNKIDTVAR
jgi:hypothetical protein